MSNIAVMIGPITLYTNVAFAAHPSDADRIGQPVQWGVDDSSPTGDWEELFQLRTLPNTIKWNIGDERSEVKTGQSLYPVGEVRESGLVKISGECFDLRLQTIARLKGNDLTTVAADGGDRAYQTVSLDQGFHVPTRSILMVGQSPDVAVRQRTLNLYIPCATLKGPDEVAGNETEPSTYTFMINGLKQPGYDIATLYAEHLQRS